MPQTIRRERSSRPEVSTAALDADFARLWVEAKTLTRVESDAVALVPVPRATAAERLVVAAEPAPIPPFASLTELWQGLLAGELEIVEGQTTETHCYLTLRSRRTPGARASARDVLLLEQLFRGACLKAVAFDLNCALSTISSVAKKCLRGFGLDSSVGHAPLLLAMAACSRSALDHPITGLTCTSEAAGVTRTVVAVERPDATLAHRLSPAEYRIARLILDGKSHREIAAVRSRSLRTVANQISSIFHKLAASGRFQLLALALRLYREQ